MDNLSSAIGASEQLTARLLIEIGARKGMSSKSDNWALVSRSPFPEERILSQTEGDDDSPS